MDPIKSGGNWYVYCGNNPLKYVDPTGKFINVVTAGIGAIAGAAAGAAYCVFVCGNTDVGAVITSAGIGLVGGAAAGLSSGILAGAAIGAAINMIDQISRGRSLDAGQIVLSGVVGAGLGAVGTWAGSTLGKSLASIVTGGGDKVIQGIIQAAVNVFSGFSAAVITDYFYYSKENNMLLYIIKDEEGNVVYTGEVVTNDDGSQKIIEIDPSDGEDSNDA